MAKATLQTVDRALQLLEILSGYPQGMSAKEIEEVLELNKVTVHRLLATLENRGYVEREGSYYKIGLKLVELSSMRLNSIELKTEATPYLRELVNKLSLPVQLAILEEFEAVFIDKVENVNTFRMYSQIGKRIALYASGVGKILLMEMENEEILSLLSKLEFQKFTSKTLESPQAVLEQIIKARKTGYAIDDEEHEKGVFCIAVPIYDYRGKVIAALSVGGTEHKFIKDTKGTHIEQIKETAKQISARLGFFEV